MPTTLNSGLQLPDKGSVDWYSSMQTNYNLLDNHLENTDIHVTAEDKANWDSKQGSLSQTQLDAIAQVATNTSDITALQSGKANASHTHSSSDITDIDDYATKQYVDNSISGLVDSAPNALDTLNELAAALNDDANFASTVATALATKANSADLATVATSGDYDDLSNKPSIPTNTSDLNNDSGFVTLNDFDIPAKTSDLTNDSGFITSSDVPTSTSDLINDSNFVDTSNSAVASGITSAKVTDYDTHIADTDIHVTTADKNKWNNGVSQSYVFRYSSTALVASSTNSNTLLDNTDNLKVGDKVIDSSGVLFSITAIDTVNSTFTVGSALIDLALDANVVHTSGNETVGGVKTFTSSIKGYNSDSTQSTVSIDLRTSKVSRGNTSDGVDTFGFGFRDKNNVALASISCVKRSTGGISEYHTVNTTDSSNNVLSESYSFNLSKDGDSTFRPETNDKTLLGTSTNNWKGVYATNYYYGSNNVEFSTKFVTSDTAQTISGAKTFSSSPVIYNSDTTATAPQILFKNSKTARGSTTETGAQLIYFADKNNTGLGMIENRVISNGSTSINIVSYNTGADNNTVSGGVSIIKSPTNTNFAPTTDNAVTCGRALAKWSDVQTYKVNALEPSSLGMPANRADSIDISSYFTQMGSGDTNAYDVSVNGYIYLQLTNIVTVHCLAFENSSSVATYIQTFSRGNDGQLYVLFPVRKNDTFKTQWYTGSTVTVNKAMFIPCQGNV